MREKNHESKESSHIHTHTHIYETEKLESNIQHKRRKNRY